MKQFTKRLGLLMAAMTLLLASWIPANAESSTRTLSGKNNIVILSGFQAVNGAEVYMVNSRNELWQFRFPGEVYTSAYLSASNQAPTVPRPASSQKIMDGVAEIRANGNLLILKQDGTLFRYSPLWETYTQVADGIASIVSPFVSAHNADLSHFVKGAYLLRSNGELWHYTENFTPVALIDRNVVDGTHDYYLKGDGILYNIYVSSSGGVTSKPFLYDVSAYWEGPNNVRAALKRDGSLWMWGNHSQGQTGLADTTDHPYVEGSLVLGGVTTVNTLWIDQPGHVFDHVAKVFFHNNQEGAPCTSVVTTDGSVYTWGGQNPKTHPETLVPRKLTENQWLADTSYYEDSLGGIGPDVTVTAYPDGRLVLRHLETQEYAYPPVNHNYENGTDVSGEETFLVGTWPAYTFEVNMTPLGARATPALTAVPTASTVLVDGEQVAFDAYNIEGANFFKLRDLAYVLSGTEKQFEVAWDSAANAISLISDLPYTPVGGEMAIYSGDVQSPAFTSSKILLNGTAISLTAYNIGGNNYFKLRDIGCALDFEVDWDGVLNIVMIDTNTRYTPD